MVVVGQPKLNELFKQLAKIQAHGAGLAGHKACGRHTRQGVDLKYGKAVVRAQYKVGPAVAAQAKGFVRCKGKLLHPIREGRAYGRRAYFAGTVLGEYDVVVEHAKNFHGIPSGRSAVAPIGS